MGLLSRILNRPLTKDGFAEMLVKRLRASGEVAPIEYDSSKFELRKSGENVFFLHNFYAQFLRLPKSDHEQLIRTFLTTWHSTRLKAPENFADAKADLLTVLRHRAYFEIDLHLISDTFRSKLDVPHQVIAEHLVAALVYDLPQSMMSVSSELLDQWGVTFYEAMEVAKQNLRENTRQFAKLGNIYAFMAGDSYDATRMLLTDYMREREVLGDTIAMVPNREVLYLCGADDVAGLEMMSNFAKEQIQHERFISGMAFRLVDDEWEVWLPPEDHPSYGAFRNLYMQSLGQTYGEQKNLLEKRFELEKTDIFVASFSGLADRNTGREMSFCTWTEGVDSLLPETDQVFFFRPTATEDRRLAARGDWEDVKRVMGDRLEPQGMYPERWRVREFPDDGELAKIGM